MPLNISFDGGKYKPSIEIITLENLVILASVEIFSWINNTPYFHPSFIAIEMVRNGVRIL